MGYEQPAEWYDEKYVDSVYNRPIEKCGYYNLYKNAFFMLPENKKIKILELGCGTGRFASLVYKAGYKNYIGVDFSKVAIKEARRYVPDYQFIVSSVFDDKVKELIKEYDVFVILETLEHVKRDRWIIKQIPKGSLVIFSVPPGDYISHVRHFLNFKSVYKRFGDLLDFSNCKSLVVTNKRKPSKKGVFLFNPIKKGI